MNQSTWTNSFGNSCQQTNELWKACYSSFQSETSVQNANQVYENLLRIREQEEIDAALPEIQSPVNKALHVNERKFLPENRILCDPFFESFNDTGTSLEDIEIYQDIFNGSTINIPNTINTADYGQKDPPIFADNEIEQYLSKQLNYHRFPSPITQPDEEDPLQFWQKLNCKDKHVDVQTEALDLSKKPTKSVLAIFDFTMPSLSSSASSSPGNESITIPYTSPQHTALEKSQINTESTNPNLQPSVTTPLGLPTLIPIENPTKPIKRKKKSMKDSTQHDHKPSSPAKGKTKKSKPLLSHITDYVKSKSIDKPVGEIVGRPSRTTSPTLRAGAAYIEQQLSQTLVSTPLRESFPKSRSSKHHTRPYNTRSTSKPKQSDENNNVKKYAQFNREKFHATK